SADDRGEYPTRPSRGLRLPDRRNSERARGSKDDPRGVVKRELATKRHRRSQKTFWDFCAFLWLIRLFVGVFQVHAEVAVHAGVAVDTQSEALIGDLIDDALAEFDDVLLEGFVARWVIEDFSNNTGVAGAQYIAFRNADQGANLKTGHNRIV